MIRHLAFILLHISGVLSSCKNPNHLRIGNGKSPIKSLLMNLTITKVINVIEHPEWNEDKWSLGNCSLLCHADWECRAFDWHVKDRVCTLGSAFDLTDTEDPLVAKYIKVFGPDLNYTDPEGEYCRSEEEMDRVRDILLRKNGQTSSELQLFSPISKDSNTCPSDSVSVLQLEMINRSKFIHKNLNITDPINETSYSALSEDKWYIGNCAQMCDANWECRAFEWHRENRTCKIGRAFDVISELEEGSVVHYKRLFGEFVDNHQEKGSSCLKRETLFEWVKQLTGDEDMQTTPQLSLTSSVEFLSSTSQGADVDDSSTTSSLPGDGSSSTEGKTEEGETDSTPAEMTTATEEGPNTSMNPTTTSPFTKLVNNVPAPEVVKCVDGICVCPKGMYILANTSTDFFSGMRLERSGEYWYIYDEGKAKTSVMFPHTMDCIRLSNWFEQNGCHLPLIKNGVYGEREIICEKGVQQIFEGKQGYSDSLVAPVCDIGGWKVMPGVTKVFCK